MNKIFLLLAWSFLIAQTSIAGELRLIKLTDGSVITGEILNFNGTTYTINSDSLGKIDLDSEKIQAITSPGTSSAPMANSAVSSAEISAMQQQLLNNPNTMKLLESLQNDPQIQSLLNDPQIMQAIFAGDMQTLMNNPEFKALLENPTIQQIQSQTLR